jgi:hypothetical protein
MNLFKSIKNLLKSEYGILALLIFNVVKFVLLFLAITSGEIPRIFKLVFSHFITQAIMLIWIGYRYQFDKYGAILNYILFSVQFYFIFLWDKRYTRLIELFQGEITSDDKTKELNEVERKKMLVVIRKQFGKRFDDKMTREQILREVQDKMDFLGKDDLDQEAILAIYNKYFGINEKEEIEKMYKNAVEYSPAKI